MSGEDDLYFGEEEGESMVGFDVGRRERSIRGGREVRAEDLESGRRLSLELEAGFADGSDDEGDDRRT